MTKQEKLEALIKEKCLDRGHWLDSSGELEDPFPLCVEYRPFVGWFLSFLEPRYIYDCGEFMGVSYVEAVKWIRKYF